MKNIFWKVFAIITLIFVSLMFYFYTITNRYSINNNIIFDKWTGNIHFLGDWINR